MQTKKSKKVKIIQKPYLKGHVIDSTWYKRSLKALGNMVMVLFIYLVIGSTMSWDSLILTVLTNGVIVALGATVMYMSGLNMGISDVTTGEIMYQRRGEDKPVSKVDERSCYHPMKGFACAAIGAAPFLALGIILAVLAKVQTFSLGALPSWLTSYERRAEIGGALLYYHESYGMGALDYIRVIVRICILPFINMFSDGGANALLWVERLSPLLILTLPVAFGVGYTGGVKARTKVHTDIAANKRKKKKQEQKRRAQREEKGPERLI